MTESTPRHACSLVIEREMPHPPEKVWRALTESPLIEEWLMKNDFQPVVGHRFSFRATPVPNWNGIIDCEVLVVEPHSRLSYSWGALGLESVVTWTLTPTEGGTHVRMEQSGFPSEEGANYKGAKYGWQKFHRQPGTCGWRGWTDHENKIIAYWTMTVLVAFFIGGGGVAQIGNIAPTPMASCPSLATRCTSLPSWDFGRCLEPLPSSCRVFRGSRNGRMPASSST